LFIPKPLPVLCPEIRQPGDLLVIVLFMVSFAIALNCKPQLPQLLAGGTVLNLAGDRVEPLA